MALQLIAVIFFVFSLNSAALSAESSSVCEGVNCELKLEPSEQDSNAGYFSVEWNSSNTNQIDPQRVLIDSADKSPLYLQLSTNESFSPQLQLLDVTHQDKIHLTGYDDGTYFLRLLDEQQNVLSNVASVTVTHHPLARVWLVFGIGALMFVILIGYMISRAFRSKETSTEG
ncbi:hypothetical protein [Kangiella koreensis]|uniref:Uncharacterized protein n=1 Tax=Kangiella koreensis (strain DSM 16069 / JCM 12317 / KCTC 12182 / SW-125) TaxID=523791 RepID=C7R708_KANKD|nr:hypothetical protein [Kangiella koreensis]ACV27464.1 hypothetical protein Kkor_2054 [Kangiella koreensis DSM 16069]